MIRFGKKIPAQALQFVLLISTLVFLLLGSFILLTYTQSFFRVQSTESRSYVAMATHRLVDFIRTYNLSQTRDTIRTDEGRLQTNRIATYHGAWSTVFSEVISNGTRVRRAALIGTKTEKSPNLYLSNYSSPLVVVGRTRLEGELFVPELGIQAGTIGGRYYEGQNLHHGEIRKSTDQLPKLNPQWLSYTEKLLAKDYMVEAYMIRMDTESKNSFYGPPRIVYEPGPIVLGQQEISGNVHLYSDTKITVHPEALLSDVLLIAPEIHLLGNVQGRMHLIASRHIMIDEGCHLSYPSSVVLLSKEKPVSLPSKSLRKDTAIIPVEIKEKTTIEGSVVYIPLISPDEQSFSEIHVKTYPGTTLKGELYCQGNLDFQGTVMGSLYTDHLVAGQEGSLYINHIYDGHILKNSIPQYAGLPIENRSNTIAKWMY